MKVKTVTVWVMDDDSLDAIPIVHEASDVYLNENFVSVYSEDGSATGYRVMDVKKYQIVVVEPEKKEYVFG